MLFLLLHSRLRRRVALCGHFEGVPIVWGLVQLMSEWCRMSSGAGLLLTHNDRRGWRHRTDKQTYFATFEQTSYAQLLFWNRFDQPREVKFSGVLV